MLEHKQAAGLLYEGPDTEWKDGSSIFGPEPPLICLQVAPALLRSIASNIVCQGVSVWNLRSR